MHDSLQQAVAAIRAGMANRDGGLIQPKLAIVLGSGLGKILAKMDHTIHMAFEEIPHFPVSTVAGHRGAMVIGRFMGVDLLALSGRVHFYEGYPLKKIVFPIRVMASLGIEKLIITNASGAINEAFQPGDIVLIKDHINLMTRSLFWGSDHPIDMAGAYSRRFQRLAEKVAGELNIPLREGIYCLLGGPSYETPAEIGMLRTMGADLAGMSTIPEVMTANSLGLKVLGLSMVTNMAAGITGSSLTHEEVIETSNRAGNRFRQLVGGIVSRL
jgi:purine-nucleoside phosphorylase